MNSSSEHVIAAMLFFFLVSSSHARENKSNGVNPECIKVSNKKGEHCKQTVMHYACMSLTVVERGGGEM